MGCTEAYNATVIHLKRTTGSSQKTEDRCHTTSWSMCLNDAGAVLHTGWIWWFHRWRTREDNSTRVNHRWSWTSNEAKLVNSWWRPRRSYHVCTNLLWSSLPRWVASNSRTARRHPVLTCRQWHSMCPTQIIRTMPRSTEIKNLQNVEILLLLCSV